MSFERHYDADNDRLFLVFYPITPGYNANNWGVSERSLDANIKSAINRPVVIYRKQNANPFHTKQAGSYIHPTIEEAAAELGYKPNAQEYFDWQEKFAVGRIRNVEKRNEGYAWTLEITNPEIKNILKEDKYTKGIPGWTSPQILGNYRLYPDEDKTQMYDHWIVSHVALVDIPAYGYEQAGIRGKCLGQEQECMIKTKNASIDLGFCVKQATLDLLNSRSSLGTQNEKIPNINMSMSEQSQPTQQEVVTTKPTVPEPETVVNTPQQQTPEAQPKEEIQPTQEGPKSLDEAKTQFQQMNELIKDQGKQIKLLSKELEQIRAERKQARLSYIIPRDLFKSDESHLKEVQKTMNENVSEEWLTEYWKTKRELAMMQNKKMELPLVAKSASVQQDHDVPNFNSSESTSAQNNVRKQLELQKMILDGGSSY